MSSDNLILDLGCGDAKIPGAIGLDNVLLPSVDVVHDLLDFPYPFESGTVKKIYLRHVVEHFTLPDLQKILQEAHRILQPGGQVHIHVPHVFCVAAWADPTHRTSFTFNTARFFDADSPKAYYKEIDSRWKLMSTSAAVTWLDWKGYRMRQLDQFLSAGIAKWLNWLLQRRSMPSSADLLVKFLPLFFVEIRWVLEKH